MRRSIQAARLDMRAALRVKAHGGHRHLLADIGPTAGGIAKEELVEIGTADVEAVGVDWVEPVGEGDALAQLVRDELRPRLEDADALDILQHTQAREQAQVLRQQRFADVKARMPILLQKDDVTPALGQQSRCGRACRSAANDKNVAGLWRQQLTSIIYRDSGRASLGYCKHQD
jgi:hypothetical protein